jgi:amino acid permease
MLQLIDQILANPVYTIIAVVILAVLVFAIIKKVIKLIITILILIAAYLAYVNYAGDDVQQTIDKTVLCGTETAKDVKKKVEENKQVQEVKKKIEKELKK